MPLKEPKLPPPSSEDPHFEILLLPHHYCSSNPISIEYFFLLPIDSLRAFHSFSCPYSSLQTTFTMASSLRAGSTLLRSSAVSSRPFVQKAAYNGVRCASTKVSIPSAVECANRLTSLLPDPQRSLCCQAPWRDREGQEAEERLWLQGPG